MFIIKKNTRTIRFTIIWLGLVEYVKFRMFYSNTMAALTSPMRIPKEVSAYCKKKIFNCVWISRVIISVFVLLNAWFYFNTFQLVYNKKTNHISSFYVWLRSHIFKNNKLQSNYGSATKVNGVFLYYGF